MDGLLHRLEQNGLKKGTTQGMEWHMSPKIEDCTHEISCVMLHEGIPHGLLGDTILQRVEIQHCAWRVFRTFPINGRKGRFCSR